MRELKLISIYIVGDNNAEELEKCFRCLLTQTNCNFEIIFRDNKSVDDTYEMAVKYSGLFKQKDIFMSVTRNKERLDYNNTIRLMTVEAEGTIFVYYKVGDIVDNYYIERIYEGMEQKPYGAVVLDDSFDEELNCYIISKRPSSTQIAFAREYSSYYSSNYETMGNINHLYCLFIYGLVSDVKLQHYEGFTRYCEKQITYGESNLLDVIEMYRLIISMERKAAIFRKQNEVPEYHWMIKQLVEYAESIQYKLNSQDKKIEAERCGHLINTFKMF